jgi:hypothetical protein
MSEIRIALNEEQFRKLVAGEEVRVEGHSIAGVWRAPVCIILSDIGFGRMLDAITTAGLAASEQNARKEQVSTRCRLSRDAFGRWIIVHEEQSCRAWSGLRWVPIDPVTFFPAGGVQVSNFDTQEEAATEAAAAGLTVLWR